MDQDLANTQIAAALASLYSASVSQAGILMKLSTAIARMDPEMKTAARDALEEMDAVLEAFKNFQTAFDAYHALVAEAVHRGENG